MSSVLSLGRKGERPASMAAIWESVSWRGCAQGRPVGVTVMGLRDLRSQGPDSIVDANRTGKHAVQQAVEEETIPVELSGNRNSAVGTIVSGNIEGMTLLILTGIATRSCGSGLCQSTMWCWLVFGMWRRGRRSGWTIRGSMRIRWIRWVDTGGVWRREILKMLEGLRARVN